MAFRQHRVSKWVLKSFSRPAGQAHVLEVYDKTRDTYDTVSIEDFLAETDAHSTATEEGFARIEGPASRAALGLWKRAKRRPPGLYALAPVDVEEGPAYSQVGEVRGIALQVSEHQVAAPPPAERLALARFVGLMYSRAPKVEAASIELGDVYMDVVRAMITRAAGWAVADIVGSIDERRQRMAGNAESIGQRVAAANWWVARAGPERPFVVGDNPVGTSATLGIDDRWRPILADQTFVIALPLGPGIALVVAPNAIIPTRDVVAEQVSTPINRLLWRSADRYVVGRTRAELDAAVDGGPELRRTTIPVEVDLERVSRHAAGDVSRILLEVREIVDRTGRLVPWFWDECRFAVRAIAVDARDRHLVTDVPPCR